MENVVKLFIKIFYLYLVFILSGCASTATGPEFGAIQKPRVKTGESTVYIFRTDTKVKIIGDRYIEIDGEKIQNLADQGFISTSLKPGKHQIILGTRWSARNLYEEYNPPKIDIIVEPGEEYYIQFLNLIADYGVVVGMNTGYRDFDVDSKINILNKEEITGLLLKHKLHIK